jgi:hypothetical protein
MSTYGNTASIFQLAFGVNAVLPTVYFAYRRAHDSLAKRLAEEISNIDPSLTFGEREMIVVRHFVRYGFPGMRLSRSVGFVLAGLFGVAVGLSFLGLLLSAINTGGDLADWLVLLFSAFALVLCPVAGILYDRWLWFFEQQVVLRLDRPTVLIFLEPIKQSLVFDEFGEKMREITKGLQEFLLKTEEDELRREWHNRKVELWMRWRNLKGKMRNGYQHLGRWFRR